MSETLPLNAETRGIARNASILALGNVTSRVLGLAREIVKAKLFGSSPAVDALNLVIIIINQIYDLVTGGIVNSALVPVFNEYTAEERQAELWRLASLLLSLVTVTVSALVLLIIWFAPQVVALFAFLGGGKGSADTALAVWLLRLAAPAVICLSVSGILTSLLYALRRFTLPAFTGAVFNASMVLAALALAAPLGVAAMALGALIGAAAQVALQLPGLRHTRLRPTLNWRHAGLRRIFRLYLPIVAVTLVSQAAVYFGVGVGWEFEGGLSWMNYATTLYQFPLGLVAMAISVAILPTLALQAREAEQDFKPTLVQGLNLVLLLIVPATVGLFVLARPIVGLVFERGAQTAYDTSMTALVLQLFLLGLSFAAVDQVLIFAFYARQDTLAPALVGIFSVGVYVAVVLVLRRPLGIFSLMVADAIKQITHALVTGGWLARRLGGFGQSTLWPTLGKILIAAGAMGLGVAAAGWLVGRLPVAPGFWRYALEVGVPGLAGLAIYFAGVARLKIAEARLVASLIQQKLGV